MQRFEVLCMYLPSALSGVNKELTGIIGSTLQIWTGGQARQDYQNGLLPSGPLIAKVKRIFLIEI